MHCKYSEKKTLPEFVASCDDSIARVISGVAVNTVLGVLVASSDSSNAFLDPIVSKLDEVFELCSHTDDKVAIDLSLIKKHFTCGKEIFNYNGS